MTVHQVRIITLAAVLIGIGALVPMEACTGAQLTLDEQRALAEQGDAEVQQSLGRMYANGEGVPQDHAEATRWYRLAADQGHAYAQFYLGQGYGFGLGVPKDHAEAARWYRLAADQGNALAQLNLGVMYRNGEGVPQDSVESHMWLNLAAAHSSLAEAQRRAREWTPTPEP